MHDQTAAPLLSWRDISGACSSDLEPSRALSPVLLERWNLRGTSGHTAICACSENGGALATSGSDAEVRRGVLLLVSTIVTFLEKHLLVPMLLSGLSDHWPSAWDRAAGNWRLFQLSGEAMSSPDDRVKKAVLLLLMLLRCAALQKQACHFL